LLKPTVAQLFVRFSFLDLFSFVPMASRAALKNAAQKKRRRENAMVASELVEGAIVPPDNEDGERTISDLVKGEDGPEGMVIESIDEDAVLEQGTAQPEETGDPARVGHQGGGDPPERNQEAENFRGSASCAARRCLS
jgi:hypothetical protein